MFTYTLGGHALMLGRQQVGDDGGFVWLNQGSLSNDSGTRKALAVPASTCSPTA
jgi:hypothetical protein